MSDLWTHSSTKYNGGLHYRYPVQLIHCSDDCLVAYHEAGQGLKSHRGAFTSRYQWLSFYWIRSPYVLTVQWEADWRPRSLYIDIATATGWRDGTVGYVDLDLDLILAPGSDLVHLDDEDEFEEHRRLWDYPDGLVMDCHAAVEEVRGLFARRESPFDPAIFVWRPGDAPPV